MGKVVLDGRGRTPVAVAWLVAVVALAGCLTGDPTTDNVTFTDETPAEDPRPAGPDEPGQAAAPGESSTSLEGRVQDESDKPVAGARVEVVDLAENTTTDEEGVFVFRGLPLDTFLLRVTADGYLPWDQHVRGGSETVILTVELVRSQVPPFHESVPFEGFIECAMEVLIIPGSCGRVVTEYTEQEDPFETRSVVEHATRDGWKTIIVDVTWQDLPSTLEGLRVSAYAAGADNDLGEYERFARAWGSEPFTLRIDAGEQYEEGPQVPIGPAMFQFEVFPQGHGYNAVCDPDGTCFLGVGAGVNVEFEVFLTTFYHETAPEGWTIADA